MELSVNYLSKSSDFTIDYILKLLREANIENHILLNKDDLIKFRDYIKKSCTTHKRYSLYLILDNKLVQDVK